MKTTFTLLRQVLACIFFFSYTMVSASDDMWAGIHCPGDKYVDCDAELWDLSIYGNATYKDYSGEHDAGKPVEKWHLNSCNQGYITRTWKVKIYSRWYSCTQTIHVGGGSHDTPEIYWPEDMKIEGCNPNLDPDHLPDGRPTWKHKKCQMLGTSYEDKWFYFDGKTCKKLVREWTVMDWCKHDPVHYPDKGKYTHTQVIKVTLGDEPEFTCPDNVTVTTADCEGTYVSVDPLVIDDSDCDTEYDISNDSPYADKDGADISGNYPVGTTTVKYTVKYGCGRKKHCTVKVTVDNNKAPTPYCHAYMSVALMGIDNDNDGVNDEGMVEIWAKDLDAGSFGNCGKDDLKFSFSEDPNDDVKVFTCDDVGDNDVRMYVFDNAGNYSYCVVELSVQNNSARIQDCEEAVTEVEEPEEEKEEITDPDPQAGEGEESAVDSSLMVTGNVIDAFGNLVADAAVEVTTPHDSVVVRTTIDTIVDLIVDSTEISPGEWDVDITIDTTIITSHDTLSTETRKMITTDGNGTFAFHNLFVHNKDYKVTGYGFEEIPYEITVSDLWVIFNHLKGEDMITDPMLLLAADVNQDGNIDNQDMREIIDVITGREDAFSIQKGAYIMRMDEALNDPQSAIHKNGGDYYMLENMESSFTTADFVMVYIGKLTNPASNARRNVVRSRSIIDQTHLSDAQLMQALNKFFGIVPGKVAITPNPTQGNLQMHITAQEDQAALWQLFSIDGRLMKQENFSLHAGDNTLQTNIQEMKTGVYFYRTQIDGQLYTDKIIKTK